jgi:hypothetical protein
MIEYLRDGDTLLAILLRAAYQAEGIQFFTPDDFSQQLGYMQWPAGHRIQAHSHRPVPRQVTCTHEVLFIKRGRVRADFYDEQQHYRQSRILSQGDVLLLAAGGHGFEMLEPSEIIEVKQGPYGGADDKIRFVGIGDAAA